MLFVLFGQCYFAVEWLFAGVEGKVFAYAAILAAIGLAWRDKDLGAVGLAAAATYFHFLVGGFWAVAIIGLIGLKTKNVRRTGGALLAYAMLCGPMLAILLGEWFFAPTPDLSDLDLTITQIYSAFRNPHHVAPFSGPHGRMVARDQLDGGDDLLAGHAGVAGTFRAPRAGTLAARYVHLFDTVVRAVLFRSSYLSPRTAHPVSAQRLDPAAGRSCSARFGCAKRSRGMLLERSPSSRSQSASALPSHAQCPSPILSCPPNFL
jgi:hypothetical protein